MVWKMCANITPSRKICWDIPVVPVLMKELPDFHSDYDDWITIGQPEPQPWKGDLVALATIDSLIDVLSDAKAQRTLRNQVKKQFENIQSKLPQGVELDSAQG